MSEDLVRRSDVAPLLCSRCRESAPEFDKFGAYHGEGDRRYHCAADAVYELPAAGKAAEPQEPARSPKCAMCDGSGRKGGWGDISDTPCPSCRVTGRRA